MGYRLFNTLNEEIKLLELGGSDSLDHNIGRVELVDDATVKPELNGNSLFEDVKGADETIAKRLGATMASLFRTRSIGLEMYFMLLEGGLKRELG